MGIPYACIFSYHCIRLLWLKQAPGFRFSLRVSQALSILPALAALIWHDPAYTLVTAVLLGSNALLYALRNCTARQEELVSNGYY